MKKTVFFVLLAVALVFGFILVSCGDPSSTNGLDTGVLLSVYGQELVELVITDHEQAMSVLSRAAQGGNKYVLKIDGETISEGTVTRSDNKAIFTSTGNKTWSASVNGKSLSVENYAVPKDGGNFVPIGKFESQKTDAEIKAFSLEGKWVNPNGSNPSFEFTSNNYNHYTYPSTPINNGTFSRNTNGARINFTPSEGTAWSQGFEIIGDDMIFIIPIPAHNYGPFVKFKSDPSVFEGTWKKGEDDIKFFGNLCSAKVPVETYPDGTTNGGRIGTRFTYTATDSGKINLELNYGLVIPVSYTLTGSSLFLQNFPEPYTALNGTYTKQP